MLSSGVVDDKFVMRVFVVLCISVCSCYSSTLVFPTNSPNAAADLIHQLRHERKPALSVVSYEVNTTTPREAAQCRFEEKDKKFPWTALIQYRKANNSIGYHCGGTLIGKQSVLTAAHCLTGETFPKHWEAIAVRLGEWGQFADNDCRESSCLQSYMDISIESYHVPIPSRPELIDIAVLKLKKPVSFTSIIRPACLPPAAKALTGTPKSYFGRQAYISARRRLITEIDDPKPVEPIDITSWDVCNSRYDFQNVSLMHTNHICALSESGIDTCEGDSGGGLFVADASEFFLIGVLSFGPKPCGNTGLPAVYTRIDTHMLFIRRYLD